MSPVLKWAGGKTQLLEHIADSMPADYNNYYEPFIGGAAVLFGVSPAQAFVNDVNEQLINLYTQLKIAAESVIAKVNEMDATPCTKELYYAIREQYNTKIASRDFDAECAALMIWINKHCFNGLYHTVLIAKDCLMFRITTRSTENPLMKAISGLFLNIYKMQI